MLLFLCSQIKSQTLIFEKPVETEGMWKDEEKKKLHNDSLGVYELATILKNFAHYQKVSKLKEQETQRLKTELHETKQELNKRKQPPFIGISTSWLTISLNWWESLLALLAFSAFLFGLGAGYFRLRRKIIEEKIKLQNAINETKKTELKILKTSGLDES